MANFYYGSDSGQNYWINLNHVSHMKLENDKLILKMLDKTVFVLDKKDYEDIQEFIVSETVNCGTLFDNQPPGWNLL
jgi:hypothetical protein